MTNYQKELILRISGHRNVRRGRQHRDCRKEWRLRLDFRRSQEIMLIYIENRFKIAKATKDIFDYFHMIKIYQMFYNIYIVSLSMNYNQNLI